MTGTMRTARSPLGLLGLAVAAASWSCLPAGAEPATPMAGGQAGQHDVVPIPPFPPPPMAIAPPGDAGEPGLSFRLEEGPARLDTTPREPAPPANPLSASATGRLLARLPAAPPSDTGATPSPFPPVSPPPPRTGATLFAPFPPPDTLLAPRPGEVAAGPLEVLRVAPTGETELAPHLSITFSQPMVPLAALGEIAARAVPVRLRPETPGRWSWLDTRTLRFEPDPRFPMATAYTVEVPAGVRSELGGSLGQAVRTGFATPAPTANGGYPHAEGFAGRWGGAGAPYPPGVRRPPPPRGGASPTDGEPAPLDPVILVAFDQRIDSAAVLATTRLTANGRSRDVRLATAAEVEADSVVRALVARVEPGRWVALRPVRPLPTGAEIRVEVGPGTPSAEGPRTTTSPQELRFRTYGPLVVEEHGCSGPSPRECHPAGGFWVRFSNPLDDAAWSDDLARVEPEIPELRLWVQGGRLLIQGRTALRTTYRVTLEPGIRDVFGQVLGARRTIEFRTSDPGPTLSLPGAPLMVLDPTRPARVAVHSAGHGSLRVRVHQVSVEHWDAYQDQMERFREERAATRFTPPGQPVLDTVVTPDRAADDIAETWIDLAPALTEGLGHAVVVVETAGAREAAPTPGARRPPMRPDGNVAFAWVQSTRIGLNAAVDGRVLQAWATSLVDGRPLSDVRLTLQPSGQSAATDRNGLATLPLTPAGDRLLVARHLDDTAFVPESPWGRRSGRDGWRLQDARSELRWLVFSDRGLYRPGEQAHVKGWIRALDTGPGGDIALAHDVDRVRFTVIGPRREEMGTGEMRTGLLGGFGAAIDLPRELNTGHAYVRFEATPGAERAGAQAHMSLRVHEFRRPDYQVTIEADAGPHVVGGTVSGLVRAAYYGGGALAEAAVDWRATARTARFTPPGWDRWHFGRILWGPRPGGRAGMQLLTGTTDRDGEHHVRVDLLDTEPPFTAALRLEAQVQDVDRQAGSGNVDVLVHPGAYYVGLRAERGWAAVGDSVPVRIVVVDLDGGPVAGRSIELRVARLEHVSWPFPGGRAPARARAGAADPAGADDPLAGDVVCQVTSGTEPAECVVVLTAAGPHVLRAEVRDEQGRPSRTELSLWVAGPPTRPAVDRPGGEALQLVPDREEYQPGDTARVLVQAPFHPAEGLWTLRRGGIVETGRFRTDGPSHPLSVPILESQIPGVHLHVELVGDPGSEYSTGEEWLPVPAYARTLDVGVTVADTVTGPGATTAVTVDVRDAQGRPRPGAEVTLWLVDESVLAVGGYRMPDPIGAFYARRWGGVRDHPLRRMIVRARPDRLGADEESGAGAALTPVAMAPPPPMEALQLDAIVLEGAVVEPTLRAQARGAGATEDADLVDVRQDFTPLAFFEPSLRTGADGRVTVPVTLPGTLTRYRVMAVAVDGDAHFGRGEATVTARRELMVRIAAPRFLSHGDRVELAVTVQNLTPGALEAEVAVRGPGLRFDDGQGRRVVVPGGDRVELRIAATAARPGPVRVEAVVASGARSDAAAVTLPVYEPGTAEAFATYGDLDDVDLVALPLSVPGDAIPGFGGLEVTVSSTALHALTDALLFLKRYPYQGPEPVASRLLAVAAVRDVLAALEAEGLPPVEQIVAAARRDVAELASMQRPDGGWGMWRGDRPSDPFVSIHAAHALQRARENDFDVPDVIMERAVDYLRTLDRHRPADVTERDWHALAAYALYVRARMADPGALDAARQRARDAGAGVRGGADRRPPGAPGAPGAAPGDVVANVGVAAAGWLLHALAHDPASAADVAELRRQLMNRVIETAAAATFATSYDDGSHVLLHSDRRSDAVVLEALIQADPRSDLVPKLARGLLDHRTRGRWRTTQENAWVLLALGRYFQEYERVSPDFAARVWVGERFAGAHEFRRRSADRWHLAVPLGQLAALNGADRVLIQRDGAGRLYYRGGLRYAPADHALPPLDRGFVVERSYEAVDDPDDVRRDEDGAWRIRAGSRVRVRVSMIAPAVRHHVALMDPLPAGLEPLNPGLRGVGFDDDPPEATGATAVQGTRGMHGPAILPPWQFRWFEHQNLRDDRAEAFASLLRAGVYEYTYLARATAYGTFTAAPPRAEEMYAPETFGRGAVDRVIIE